MSVGAVNKNTGDRIPTAGMPAIDSVLSGTSTNPVQNRVVKAALDEKVDAVSGKGLSTNDYSNTDKAKVDASLNVFTGTQAEWAALSTAEKKTYQRADFTDDYDNTAIGDLTALHTSAKSSIVNAINEVADGKQNSTDNNLQTTSKTIVGGINEVKSGLISVARIPNTSPQSAITSVAAGTNYTYTATSDGFLAVHAPLEQDAREFNVFIRDVNASEYGVSIYAKVVAYHGDVLGGLFVKAGRTYYIDNVGSNSVDLYLST